MIKPVLQLLAVGALVVCLVAPVQFFLGGLDEQNYRTVFLAGSIGWFVFSTAALATKPKRRP